jgi:hypothetical protein
MKPCVRLEDLLPFGAGFFVEHRQFSHFREAAPVLISRCVVSAERRIQPKSPLDDPHRTGFLLSRSRQPIADYRFCTAGGNEDDVAGFHLCHHFLAARLGRNVAHANIFCRVRRK